MLVHLLETDIALIRDLETTPSAFLRFHLYDTRSTARTIHGCLCRILQNPETFDVGRIDCREGKHIGRDSVNQHQRVVSANDGGRTAHAYAIEHGHTVETIGGHVDTSRLTAQHVKDIVYSSLCGVVVRHFYNVVPVVNGILLFCRHLLLGMSQRTAKERNDKECEMLPFICHLVFLFALIIG